MHQGYAFRGLWREGGREGRGRVRKRAREGGHTFLSLARFAAALGRSIRHCRLAAEVESEREKASE